MKLTKLRNLKVHKIQKSSFSKFPSSPGIYIFWNNKLPIYIGKANNLKSRLSSYLYINLETKTKKMIKASSGVSFIEVLSEFESLLLEASLIHNLQTKYNLILKDDKHPLYIKITKDKYPLVLTARKIEKKSVKAFFGPFPSSTSVKSVLSLLRRAFPYSDHKLGKRGCIRSQIGLCNPCPSIIEKEINEKNIIILQKKYLQNIRYIISILSGNMSKVKKDLEGEIGELSKQKLFEEAIKLRNKLDQLNYITKKRIPTSSYINNPHLLSDLRKKELSELKKILEKNNLKLRSLDRIECFDVSHTSGKQITASMVTFVKGEKETSLYRRFKVRKVSKADDYSSMKEVIERRVKNFEKWGKPDLIIVDGGKPQVSAFISYIKSHKLSIPVVGVAKREETLIIPKIKKDSESKTSIKYQEYKLPKGNAKNLVQRIRNEAHRFAIKYHHLLTKKYLLKS